MCIFSGSVQHVKNTRIFARLSGTGKQFIVYSMSYDTDQEVAMILPLPVALHDENTTVRFVSLDNYSNFFDNMLLGFPALRSRSAGFMSDTLSIQQNLKVHQVGAYDASFVPCLEDFDRLDSRFKLPQQVWDLLPGYKDYGFAVFKLRVPTKGEDEDREVHPMAFEFVTRHPDTLFFPTVHVHDSLFHKRATFDHYLYYQGENIRHPDAYGDISGSQYVFTSDVPAGHFVDVQKAENIVDGHQQCHAVIMYRMLPNRDTLLVSKD